jgi:hypothetical protein
MPKQASEPLYNHQARPIISRQIGVDVAGTTGCRNVTFRSNRVLPASLPPPVPRDPDEFFPVPMDININININMDIADGDASTNEGPTPIHALPGIEVVAKERAKWYENSVRRLNFFFSLYAFLTRWNRMCLLPLGSFIEMNILTS